MIDIKGLVLYKVLNKEEGYLDAWANIKLAYFGTEYASIYKALSKFYVNHSDLPTFEELELHNRNPILKVSIEALKSIDPPDVELDIAVEALVNEFTQEETLKEIDLFIDNITMLDSTEIKEELGKVLLNIEEKTLSSEEIVLMSDIEFATEPELLGLMPLMLNNTFDLEVGGMAPSEVLALGGMRGSGKSLCGSNLCVNQYEIGNSALYFSIEMRAREVFNRKLAMLSGVSLTNISRASCSNEELMSIAKTRADMFVDAGELVEKYTEHRDYPKFEKELLHTRQLKQDNQIIIIDNQNLTLANIDLTVQKFKAKFEDKLKLIVVDYLNVIAVEDKYDWKVQIATSAKLKEIARKHEVVLVAPYQIDKTGEARFSKGILDSVDVAMTLDRSEGRIDFESTKTRNMKAFEMASPMDELTMRIDANDANLPPKEVPEEKETKKTKSMKVDEEPNDMPWDD